MSKPVSLYMHEARAAAVRALLQERPSQFSAFPRREGCGVAFNSQGKLPSASPGNQWQVTAPVPPVWCFCCFWGRWDAPKCAHSWSVPPQMMVINPPTCRAVNKAAHYSEREKTSNMRRLCHMLPLKSHLPIALVVALLFRKKKKSVCRRV